MPEQTMNVLSLFSGIQVGGLDLGLERAGMTICGQVEIDLWCRTILAKHWPEVPRHDDVRTCTAWWGGRPAVDLVCGGFPCQPVSNAGKRLAQADSRWLWPATRDVIRDLRPRWVLLENVPGLLGRGMGDVLGDLAACGYDAEWDCVPACFVGAPHIRDRVWIVAYPQGGGRDTSGSDSAAEARPDVAPGRSGQHVADAEGQRGELRQTQGQRPRRPPGSGDDAVACTGRIGRWDGSRIFGRQRPPQRGRQWPIEPDVGRVASRLSTGMDGDLNAHQGCLTQARTTGLPQTDRLRALRNWLGTPAASSEPARCGICGHPLSALPCRGACAPWYLGQRTEADEDLRCMREGLLGLLAHQEQDLFARLPIRTGSPQRPQTMGSRVDRLRGLGNAVVPAVAEHIGRLIMKAAA